MLCHKYFIIVWYFIIVFYLGNNNKSTYLLVSMATVVIPGGVIPTMAKDNVLEVMNIAMINDLYFICQH